MVQYEYAVLRTIKPSDMKPTRLTGSPKFARVDLGSKAKGTGGEYKRGVGGEKIQVQVLRDDAYLRDSLMLTSAGEIFTNMRVFEFPPREFCSK